MKIPRSIRYFTAADILQDAQDREASIYTNHGLEPHNALPLDVGFKDGAEIFGIRTAALAKASGAVILRGLGVDALIRSATGREFPQ